MHAFKGLLMTVMRLEGFFMRVNVSHRLEGPPPFRDRLTDSLTLYNFKKHIKLLSGCPALSTPFPLFFGLDRCL
jgi:hypothetical protein